MLAELQPTLWGGGRPSAPHLGGRWHRLDQSSAVFHQPHWLLGADDALTDLTSTVQWNAGRRPMYDRVVDVPRLTASVPRDRDNQPATLSAISDLVHHAVGATFDHVGLNLYRDGNDSVAPHRDRLGRFRDWSVVVLVSLGGPRTLRLRPWKGARVGTSVSSSVPFHLGSGDLLVMAGACQRDWEHGIAKTAAARPRISIGYRTRQFPHGPLFQQPGVPPWTLAEKLQ